MKKLFFTLTVSVIALLLAVGAYAMPIETPETETVSQTQNDPLEAVISLSGDAEIYEDRFVITVKLDAKNLRGGTASLVYDPELINASMFREDLDNCRIQCLFEKGATSFVFIFDEPFYGETELLQITFDVLNSAEGQLFEIQMTDAVITDGKTEAEALTESYTAVFATEHHSETEPPQTETETSDQTTKLPDTQTQGETESTALTGGDNGSETENGSVTEGTDTATERPVSVTDTQTATQPSSETESDTEQTDITSGTQGSSGGGELTTRAPTGTRLKSTLKPVIIAVSAVLSAAAVFGGFILVRRFIKRKRNK